MAQQLNAGAAGAEVAVPLEHGGAVADGGRRLEDGPALPPQIGGGRVRAAGQAAAPVLMALVAGPPVADLAGPFDFDVEGALLGPLPSKRNPDCKLLPKIEDETGH